MIRGTPRGSSRLVMRARVAQSGDPGRGLLAVRRARRATCADAQFVAMNEVRRCGSGGAGGNPLDNRPRPGLPAATRQEPPMPIINRIADFASEMTEWRQDFHAHPELGFQEHRTSDIVAARLQEWGIEVHRGPATTGLVGVLKCGDSPRSIGLRADMDCLPMEEANDFAHRSTVPGRMHACGHDGHTATLLGAAKYLAETKNFDGTVHFIFQPAEEGGGGGKVMVDEGLFARFPCDAVYGIHNDPTLPLGEASAVAGVILAASDRL